MFKKRNLLLIALVIGLGLLAILYAGDGRLNLSGTVINTTPETTHVLQCVSLTTTGEYGNRDSFVPAITPDGRYVAYESDADNLVEGDDNGLRDVFVYDSPTTQRVSINSLGDQANGHSDSAVLSNDGRYVAFTSYATNLVDNDNNAQRDIFVHDRQSGATERVSIGAGGEANGASWQPAISGDGRYVVFTSDADNLVPNDDNGNADIFLYDRERRTTELLSRSTTGEQSNAGSYNPSISADGRYVAFASQADNLVAADGNNTYDIFIHDRDTKTTDRLSVHSDGTEANGMSDLPRLSADGRQVTFYSFATNLVSADTNNAFDIFWHNRDTGETRRASTAGDGTQGNGHSFFHALSPDGRYVTYMSLASNLVAGDNNAAADVFITDLQTGATRLVSVSAGGGPVNNAVDSATFDRYIDEVLKGELHAPRGPENYSPTADFLHPAIANNGSSVVFDSSATNLTEGDTNDAADIFISSRSNPNSDHHLTVFMPVVSVP